MKARRRFLIYIVGLALLFFGLVIGSLKLIDSPAKMKLRKQDETRAEDLGAMAKELSKWYERGDKLPEEIQKMHLKNVTTDRVISEDPITGKKYRYRLINEHSFELCATFVTSNMHYGTYPSVYLANQTYHFSHEEGEACYVFNLKRRQD